MEIKITGLERLQKIASQFPEVSEAHINSAILRSLVRIWEKEKQEAPVDTGNLRDRSKLDMKRFQGSLSSQMPYALAIENGSRPHFVAIEKIRPWAEKRGLNPWAIAKTIAKKGTRPNPFFKRTLEGAQEGVDIEFTKALSDIMKELSNIT